MSNYDTIKDLAVRFMQRNKMTSMYLAKEDYVAYAQNAIPLMKEAVDLTKEYPNDFAAYVVAINIVSSNVRNLTDLTEKLGDAYCTHAFCALGHEAKLLENAVLFMGRNINNDKCATLLVQESTQMFVVLYTILVNLDKSLEKLQSYLDECLDRAVPICANLYKTALSFHPSLEACVHMRDFFKKLCDDPDAFLTPEESLRPAQIKDLYHDIAVYADRAVDDIHMMIN